MARCRGCGAQEAWYCQCRVGDSDCVTIAGRGTRQDPYVPSLRLSTVDNNMVECGPGGLGAYLPAELRQPPACRIYSSVNQVIPHGTTQILYFNLERFDTDSMHSKEEDTTRIYFNSPGVYYVAGSVRWDGRAEGDRRIDIRLNGSIMLASDERAPRLADRFDQSIGTTYKFETGDFVELLGSQNSGVDVKILSEENLSPEFGAIRMGKG